jgi:hypothetical protein
MKSKCKQIVLARHLAEGKVGATAIKSSVAAGRFHYEND